MVHPSDVTTSHFSGFVEALRHQFYPREAAQGARNKLAVVRQTSSVSAYIDYYQDLLLQLPNIAEDEKRDRFIKGFKPVIRKFVYMYQAPTYDDAVSVAL